MRIKVMLGYCECNGCKNKHTVNVEINHVSSKGKVRLKVFRLCKEHVKEAFRHIDGICDDLRVDN